MTDETLIAESERISRKGRSTSRYQDTSGIEYGEEAVATPTSVIFRWGTGMRVSLKEGHGG